MPEPMIEDPPVLTREGLLLGARLALPAVPGLVAYCLAFGATAANRGLSAGESIGMSAIVYAGASQMLSLELWQPAWTPLAILTVAAVTTTVNARFVLMGAALQPWLRTASPTTTALSLFFLTDATWLIGTRYHAGGGRDHGVLLGAGVLIWAAWVLATIPGYYLGSLIAEPRRFALDLVLPIFFAVLVVPLWRGARQSALPWIMAALVAVTVQALVPGYLFIVAGAVSGALAGALVRPARG